MNQVQISEFTTALEAAVARVGLARLTGEQTSRIVDHYSMLIAWNRRTNLTRITGPREAAELHYAESLFGARLISQGSSVLDIGSGAGFPGIPIAIVRPDVQVTALEAHRKKSLFLMEAKDALKLPNLRVVTARFEEVNRETFDLLTSRALERAEAVFPSVVASLRTNQRLMLYWTGEFASGLAQQFEDSVLVETHSIPGSEARCVAIFRKA